MPNSKKIRILIADDHDLMRSAVRNAVESHASWTICGECSDGREAVALAEKLQVDIVIMDVAMPNLNGIDATRQITRRLPKTEVLIITGDQTDEVVNAAFEAGARSCIFKTDAGKHLVPALQMLVAHKPYFTPRVSEIVFKRYQSPPRGQAAPASPAGKALTEREREVVQLLAEGNSSKEVGSALGISVKTAETHRAAVMRKLEMKNFADLVRYAIRNKIIAP